VGSEEVPVSDTRVIPKPWLWVPRTKPIRLIEIHATRGNTTPEKQMGAALNWVMSANNVGDRDALGDPVWGSSFSHVIGTDGSMGTVLDDHQMPTYSAGYGGVGSTYAIDEYAISYECAQSQAQEPFTDALYDRLETEVALKCLKYNIPPVMVSIMVQRGEVPTGIVRHDRCENGIKLGKTDPGVQFNEVRFIAGVKAKMEPTEPIEEDDMKLIIIKTHSSNTQWVTDGMTRWPYTTGGIKTEFEALGLTEPGVEIVTDALMAAIPTVPAKASGGSGYTDAQAVKAVKDKL
jgi:hypothetical protein